MHMITSHPILSTALIFIGVFVGFILAAMLSSNGTRAGEEC